MVDANDGQALESRPPTFDDLVQLCSALNRAGAEYVVVGGMAVIHHGFVRATEDVDREKCKAIDTAEEAIMDLQTDGDFEAVASLVDVTGTDPGPVALAAFGLPDIVVTPPFGVVRLDVEVTFSYQAIT